MKRVVFAAVVAVLSFNVGAYTTQSYKRTGLIAQWDAIENSINTDGDGCHDPEATVWKDLSGNGADFNLSGFFGKQLNCWSTTSLVAKSCYNIPCAKSCKDYVTIEIFAKYNKTSQCLFNSGDGLEKFVATKGAGTSVQFYNAANQNYAIGGNYFFQAAAVHSPTVAAPVVYTNGVAAKQTASDTWRKNTSTTCLGRGESGDYNFTGEYYAIRLYDHALTPEEIALHAEIDRKRFFEGEFWDPEKTLVVSAVPQELGEVVPSYGCSKMRSYVDDRSEIVASAPETTECDGVAVSCVGWKLYKLDADGETWNYWMSGQGNRVSGITHPGVQTRLEWQWQIPLSCNRLSFTPVGTGELKASVNVVGLGTDSSATLTFAYGDSADALEHEVSVTDITAPGVQTASLGTHPNNRLVYVRAVLTNGQGERFELPVASYRTKGAFVYVNPTATPTAPYQEKSSGFTTLADALAYAAEAVDPAAEEPLTILFAAGTHQVTQAEVRVPVRLCPEDGAAVTLDFMNEVLKPYRFSLFGAKTSVEDMTLSRTRELSILVADGARLVNCAVPDPRSPSNPNSAGPNLVAQDGGEISGCKITGATSGYGWSNAAVKLFGGGRLVDSVFEDNYMGECVVWVAGENAIVSNCIFCGNQRHTGFGGSVSSRLLRIDEGLVTHCVITNNGAVSGSDKDSVYLNGANAALRNCFLKDNKAKVRPGIYVNNGTVENCTVVNNVKNQDSAFTGHDLTLVRGTVRNCIFYSDSGANDTIDVRAGALLAHSYTRTAEAGEGNVTGYVHFNDEANGDYTLGYLSPCLNAGENQTWMNGATDLSGAPRILADIVDMGCYEKPEKSPDDFVVLFNNECQGVAEDGVSLVYRFVAETDAADPAYTWFVDGEEQSEHGATVELTIAPGATARAVKLVVTSGGASRSAEDAVTVVPTTVYCAVGNAGADYPYGTEQTAAASLADVLTMPRETLDTRHLNVVMLEGTYPVHDLTARAPITIAAKPGDAVKLDFRSSTPGLSIYGPDAELKGVELVQGRQNAVKVYDGAKVTGCTVTDGYLTSGGGVVNVVDGEVCGCVFSGCSSDYTASTAFIQVTKGTVRDTLFTGVRGQIDSLCSVAAAGVLTNCVFRDNPLDKGSANVLGNRVLTTSGTVVDCLFLTNGCLTASRYGTIRVTGGTVRNCFLCGNSAYCYPGLYVTGGTVENCTVVGGHDNPAAAAEGLDLWQSGGTVRNCILYSDPVRDVVQKTGGTLVHSLMTVLKDGEGNLAADPSFNGAPFDYTLAYASQCREKGENQSWMDGAKDLAGNDRIISGTVDMGCFEGAAIPSDYLAVAVSPVCNGAGAAEGSLGYTLTAVSQAQGFACRWFVDGVEQTGVTGDRLTVDLAARTAPYVVRVEASTGTKHGSGDVEVTVVPTTVYVSTGGSGTPPYDTIEKAATTLADAFAVTHDLTDPRHFTIKVAAGTYSAALLTVPAATTVEPYGDGEVIVNGTGAPAITVNDDDSVLCGFSLEGSVAPLLRVIKGRAERCILRNGRNCLSGTLNLRGGTADHLVVSNFTGMYSYTHAVGVEGGLLVNSLVTECNAYDVAASVSGGIVSNTVFTSMQAGAGSAHRQLPLSISGNGLVTHSFITNNCRKGTASKTCRNGAVNINGGTLRNCLVADNTLNDCSGIVVSGAATVENCTVDQREPNGNGLWSVLQQSGGTVVNTIFTAAGENACEKTGGTLAHCRTDVEIEGEGNVTDAISYRTKKGFDYYPSSSLPIRDKGEKRSWMTSGSTDILGNPRLVGRRPEIGAVELPPRGTMIIVR